MTWRIDIRHITIKILIMTLIILYSPVCIANSFFKGSTLAIGIYNKSWGSTDSFRKFVPRPIVFRTSRKATASYMLWFDKTAHTFFNKHLQLNLGISGNLSYINKSNIFVVSLFPELRYIILQNTRFTPFISWSIAGISYLNKNTFGKTTISHFLFQDYLGFGLKFNALELSIKLLHYSGGSILTKKKGYDVPFVLNLGYNF